MKSRTIPVAIAVLLAVLLPVLGGCTGNSTTPTETTSPPTTTVPGPTLLPTVAGVDGALVYASQCSVCHGTSRQGGVAPALTDVSNFSATFLSTFISVHITGVGMPEPLRNAVTNYLKTNSTQPTTPPAATLDPAVLYASNCALCHGASRSGGLGGPDISKIQLTNFPTAARLATFISAHFSGMDLSSDRRSILADWLLN